MADYTRYGNATDFDVDLHSIYAAYLGFFESSGTDWWDKSWGGYFTSFGDFLGFGWEVMVVVDSATGRPHIAVRRKQIALFAKMLRTRYAFPASDTPLIYRSRFGESLPKDPPTTLPLTPVPTRTLSLRRLVILNDLASYRKLAQTLAAAELSYLRSRVRSGEVGVAEQLFYAGGSTDERDRGGVGVRDNGVGYTWACVKTTWWEKGGPPHGLVPGVGRTQGTKAAQSGKGLVLEVGVAVLRCANLRAVNVWPPVPEENYRKSHFIVEEWVDKRANTNPPNHPRGYGFGKSRYVSEKDIERIVDATVGAIASQENDSACNNLILLTMGDPPTLPVPLSSTLPANVLHLDVLALEHHLLRRAQEQGAQGAPDRSQPLNSLGALLQTLQIPVPPFAPLGNAGNEAFYTVLAFQRLMMAETRLPDFLFSQANPAYANPYSGFTGHGMNYPSESSLPVLPPFARSEHSRKESGSSHRQSEYILAAQRTSSPQQIRRASEQVRPRPVSMDTETGRTQADSAFRRPVTPEPTQQPGSAPPTVRSERRNITRSKTVYWDDAAYAKEGANAHDQPDESSRHPTLRASATGGDAPRGRPNPYALRTASGGTSSRSISWEAERPREALRTSSAASSPLRVSRSRGQLRGISSSSLSQEAVGRDATSGRLSGTQDGGDGKGETPADGRESKGKAKGEKSVRDVAGAIARFWVG